MRNISKYASAALLALMVVMAAGCKESSKKEKDNFNPLDVQNIEQKSEVEKKIIKNESCDTIGVTDYDIPAQVFANTSMDITHISGVTINTDLMKTGPVKVNEVRGNMGVVEAVETAIKNTPLKITKITPSFINVEYKD